MTAPGQIMVTTSYLEMTAWPPARARAPAAAQKLMLVRVEDIPTGYYRYLYRTVGEPWLWVERADLSDQDLSARIHRPGVEIHVLYAAGAPAGFFELASTEPDQIELAYFGLAPHATGHGYGLWFLEQAIATAWAREPARLWVHTCTLDHPAALGVYQRAGFTIYDRRDEAWPDPRVTGAWRRDASPHIPLAVANSNS